MSFKHHDEARIGCLEALSKILRAASASTRAVLIDDLYGHFRVALWPGDSDANGLKAQILTQLADAAGSAWTGQIWTVTPDATQADKLVYESTWTEGQPWRGQSRLRIADRYRSKVAWFQELAEPPWAASRAAGFEQPPIVVFYSFKGGLGRSTSLAAFAVRRAREGERVVVIDGDLDAPGIGTLLSPDGEEIGQRDPSGSEAGNLLLLHEEATVARWGVADYLIESPSPEAVDLRDYYHAVRRQALTEKGGEILVFSAGRVNEEYLGKIARIDFDPTEGGLPLPWPQFLEQIRCELKPGWILLDSRAGLGEPAGLLLGGLAHLHVLFGTPSEQSWQGLGLVLDRLGAERVRAGKPQAGCLLVQAMVPEAVEAAQAAKAQFAARAEDVFENHYYAQDPEAEGDDLTWYFRDAVGKDAPHQPVTISYRQALAHFVHLDNVAHVLGGEEYALLERRICERFLEETE